MKKIGTANLEASPAKAPGAVAPTPLILYVEDERDNWMTTELNLARHYKLLWAKNDREACSLIRLHHDKLQAVLMDIQLKGSAIDGIGLTRLLRGKPLPGALLPDFAQNLPVLSKPVVFVTAFLGARYTEKELLSVGGDAVVPKPVDFVALSLTLSRLTCEAIMASVGVAARK